VIYSGEEILLKKTFQSKIPLAASTGVTYGKIIKENS
jgi:hypothetical protein